MDRLLQQTMRKLLDNNRILTIATNRSDGWPQATIVGYANDGGIIYVIVGRDSQKYANIARDNRVSLAVGGDTPDAAERQGASALMLKRYPEYASIPPPPLESIVLLRIVPEVVSVLDYSKGFGHADLIHL